MTMTPETRRKVDALREIIEAMEALQIERDAARRQVEALTRENAALSEALRLAIERNLDRAALAGSGKP